MKKASLPENVYSQEVNDLRVFSANEVKTSNSSIILSFMIFNSFYSIGVRQLILGRSLTLQYVFFFQDHLNFELKYAQFLNVYPQIHLQLLDFYFQPVF